MKHYTQEQLDQYKHGDMNIANRLVCKLHLQFCLKCRNQYNDLSQDDTFIANLKKAVSTFDIPPDENELKTLCSIFNDNDVKDSVSA